MISIQTKEVNTEASAALPCSYTFFNVPITDHDYSYCDPLPTGDASASDDDCFQDAGMFYISQFSWPFNRLNISAILNLRINATICFVYTLTLL